MDKAVAIPTEAQAPTKTVNMAVISLRNQVELLEASRQLAAHYSATDMVPKQYKNRPENAAVAIMWGNEIGLAPLQSLQNIAVINGNPSLWGDALVALVKSSGLCELLSTHWDQATLTATVTTRRKGEPEEARTFSMQDAQVAGLANRDTYKNHPRRMLQARARSHVLRDVYADLIKGFQVREVIEEDAEVYGLGEKDVTPRTESETLNTLLDEPTQAVNQIDIEKEINEAKTAKEFQAAGAMIKGVDEGSYKEGLKKAWFKRKGEFDGQGS